MHFTNALNDIYDYFKTIPSSTWYTIWLVIGSSALVTGVLQSIKHFGLVVNKKKVVGLLSALSLIASYLDSIIQYGTKYPHFLGDKTVAIIGLATLVYHFFTNPLYKKIVGYLAKSEQVTAPVAPDVSTTVPPADLLS